MSQSASEGTWFRSSGLTQGQLTGIRIALAVSGVVAIIVGVVVLGWPEKVLTVVGWLFGIFFFVTGVHRLWRAFTARTDTTGMRWLSGILGVLLVVGGIVVLLNPGLGVGALATVIGIAWIVEGIAALVLFAPDSSRWLGVIYGALSVVAGVIVILLPYLAAAVFLIVAAVMLIVGGIIQLVQAFLFGRRTQAAPATS